MSTVLAYLVLGMAQVNTLHVSAAASLKESLTAIARGFEKSHAGVKVELNFAGSQQLAAQIDQGLDCDVFASADERTIRKVTLTREGAKVFAKNTLVIVSSHPQKLNLRSVAFVKRVVVAAPQVPVGGYTVQMLDAASQAYGLAWLAYIKTKIVSQEHDVRAVLAKVELKEADAGIVYATDAKEAGKKVFTFSIDPRFEPSVNYPIGVVSDSHQAVLARSFVDYVLSRSGQKILRSAGFLPPVK